MTKEQIKALEDIRAYIDFAIKNDESFIRVLGTIGHDVSGLFNEDSNFLPRTNGYAKGKK